MAEEGGEDEPGFVAFEELPHTADLALVARGRDLRELILNTCRGVVSVTAETADLPPEKWFPLKAAATDPERVLLGMVKQLLYQWEVHEGLPVAVEVRRAPDMAWFAAPTGPGEARGRVGLAYPVDREGRVKAVPKAATYHDLAIRRAGELLEVRIILDL